MGIPEDYYRATGETMGQACRRLAPTETITTVALAIGYDSASHLRKVLADRGIVIDWQVRGPSKPRKCLPEPTKEQLDAYLAARREGLTPAESGKKAGRYYQAIHKTLRARRPGALESLRQPPAPPVFTDEVLARYAEMRKRGATSRAAAQELCVDPVSVMQALRKRRPALHRAVHRAEQRRQQSKRKA